MWECSCSLSWLLCSRCCNSELLPKKSIVATSIIKKVNDWVSELCKNNNFHLIYYQHITTDFLDDDWVHLTDTSAEILADKMVDYINNFILTQNLPKNEEITRSRKWSFRNEKQEFVKGNIFLYLLTYGMKKQISK